MEPETLFKIVFGFAVVTLALVVIGFFLLFMKIVLMFAPDIYIMGIHFSKT